MKSWQQGCVALALGVVLMASRASSEQDCAPSDGMYAKVNAKQTLAGIDFWDLPGYTRSVYKPDHALITPESRVYAPLFGWCGDGSMLPPRRKNTAGAVTISPKTQGSRFTMTLVNFGANSSSGLPLPGVERFILVMEGTVEVATSPKRGAGDKRTLTNNMFAYFPAGLPHLMTSAGGAKALLYEQVYQNPEGAPFLSRTVGRWPSSGAIAAATDGSAPKFVSGNVEEQPLVPVAPEMFALRKLLPTTAEYDFNIHVMDFNPGEYLYVKEIHYNQHGLMLLEGQGIYRLADSWYPVQAGDSIWMAPFVVQWYAALGKTRSRYIINKDTNRDPMQP